MNLIELEISGISYSQSQTGAYALILNEKKGKRKLPIVIGGFEAQSIAIGMEKKINPPRPLTHDLLKNSFDRFNVKIKQIIIHKLLDGIFFSNIIYIQNKTEEIVDARTSDAVALAIRFNAPIYTYSSVLEKGGFEDPKEKITSIFNDKSWIKKFLEGQIQKKDIHSNLSSLSNKKLKDLLKQLVADENYEGAVKVRDEISKRKNLK
ncbi:MAG: bifunctional nuclease family protein [Flavobacteriaceae bacterium]|nr:bifunctional nuclease family protein [Flavobacteriaceae bacterium]